MNDKDLPSAGAQLTLDKLKSLDVDGQKQLQHNVSAVSMVKKMVNKSKQIATSQNVELQSHSLLHILEEIADLRNIDIILL